LKLPLSLGTILSAVSHEIAHAFQEATRKEIIPKSEDLKNDQDWFNVYSSRYSQGRSNFLDAYKSSQLRYRAIPIEQDAWGMQLVAPNELDKVSEQYSSGVLMKEGLGTYADMKKQTVLAKWTRRNLKEDTTPESLVELARKSSFPSFTAQVEAFMSGRDINRVLLEIKKIEEERVKADELLGLSA
jgi:hypothetical protein